MCRKQIMLILPTLFYSLMEITLPIIICGVAAVCALIFLIYYLGIYSRVAFFKVKEKIVPVNEKVPISVVICAKNEEQNLLKNLPKLFEQNYPKFEIIVVNDGSVDDTKEILEAFQKQFEELRIVNIEENQHHRMGKKLPLTIGIKGAKYDHILLTDADCDPVSDRWISHMAAPFKDGVGLVLGHSPIVKKSGFINLLSRFENFTTAVSYLSFSLAGGTYMGVGRNLAYRKDLFFSIGGFKKHYHIAGGDDDLFVNEVAKKAKTAVVVNPEAAMNTYAKPTGTLWFRQKQRHYSTVNYYKSGDKFKLFLVPFTTVLFYACTISLCFFKDFLYVGGGAILGRILIQQLMFIAASKRLGSTDAAILSPFLELIMLVLSPIIYVAQMYNKKPGWR